MLGLAVLFFVVVYLFICVVVVMLSARWARRCGRRGWVWGSVAVLVMYHLMFWDLMPTLMLHKYYCATEAGIWIHKTPEQWMNENPGVLVRLGASYLPSEFKVKSDMRRYGGHEEYMLSDGSELLAVTDMMPTERF